MAALLNGASPLQWHAQVTGRRIEELLNEAAAVQPDDGLMFLPYLSGERTPHNDPHIRGGFYGISQATTRAHLTYAVVEGIAYAFSDAAQALQPAAALENPAVIGGGARSDLLVQTIADALNIRLLRYRDVAAGAALGAAKLAALADGGMTLADIKPSARPLRVFHPDLARHQRHQRRLMRFRAMYRAVSGLTAGNG